MAARVPPPVSPATQQPRLRNPEGGRPPGGNSTYRNTVGDPRSLNFSPSSTSPSSTSTSSTSTSSSSATSPQPPTQTPSPRPVAPPKVGSLASSNSTSSSFLRPLPTISASASSSSNSSSSASSSSLAHSPKAPRAASPLPGGASSASSPRPGPTNVSTAAGGLHAGGADRKTAQPVYSPARIRRSSSWKDIKEVAMMAAEQRTTAGVVGHGGTGGGGGGGASWRGGSGGAAVAAAAHQTNPGGATLRRTSFSNGSDNPTTTSSSSSSSTTTSSTSGPNAPFNPMRGKPPRPARTAPNSPSSFDGTLPPRDVVPLSAASSSSSSSSSSLVASAPSLHQRKPPPQPPVRGARPALDGTPIPTSGNGPAVSSFTPSNYPVAPLGSGTVIGAPVPHAPVAVHSPGGSVRRRSADFSSLKNQIALSLEPDLNARAELLREVREHGAAGSGSTSSSGSSGGSGTSGANNRTTGKLQDFGKNLLGRAKKLKGSRVGGKDAGDDDDEQFEDAKGGSTSSTPTGSQENMRGVVPSGPDGGVGLVKTASEPSGLMVRPISVFPGRGGDGMAQALTSPTGSRPMSYFPRAAGSAVVPPLSPTGGTSSGGFPSLGGSAASGSMSTIPSPGSGSGSVGSSSSNETPFERRTKIANELLETERSYIAALCTLVDVYQTPMLGFAKDSCMPEMAEIALQVTQIFPAVLQLIPFNRELLKRLEAVMAAWNENSTVGHIFVEMAPFLKMYKDYENSYSQTLENYTEMLKDPAFRGLIDNLDAELQRLQAARLESIIIMPIQRIPRYKLLLEDLLKRTPESHPDSPLLKEALKKVDEVAVFLDSNLKEHEQRQKVVQLTVNFNASTLLQPHRKWLREGEVGLRDPNLGNRVKKLHILLFNDILVPTVLSKLGVGGENRRDVLNRPENQWPLELMWISEPDVSVGTEKDNKGKNLQLELTGPGTNYSLLFKTPEERESWKKDILDAQEKHTRGGPNAALGDKRIGQYVFKNSTFYRGEWLRGQVHGKGEMSQHGNTYTGNFAYDLKCGLGRMVFATKELFDGDWANDLPHGQGVMEYPSGDRYEGGWKAGQRSGHGILRYANNDVYDGNWEDNFPSVRGTLTCVNGLYYDGEWQHGEFHGQGMLTTATGKVYEGGWANGQRSGRGVLRSYHSAPDGTPLLIEEYEGEWLEDMKHGVGTHKTIEGVYTGQFFFNYREGEGTMRYADGSVYEGAWKKDKRHGLGTFTAGSSASRIKKYTGEWAFDKKNGKGEIWFTNGNQFEGTFKKDLLHGNGIMKSFVNGAKLEGKWVQGNRNGNAKLTFKPSHGEETRELNGSCKEPMLEARKMRYALAPTLPDLQFNITL